MNERIKELLSEAKIYDGSTTQNITTCPSDLKKFAELIIRECATLAFDGPNGILEHFGVEE
jgi:hypothetical protein